MCNNNHDMYLRRETVNYNGMFDQGKSDFYSKLIEGCLGPKNKQENFLGIKNAYFNGDKTVIIWDDGTKTILNKNADDVQDYEKAILWGYALHNSHISKNKLASGLSNLIKKDDERKKCKLKKELNKKAKKTVIDYLESNLKTALLKKEKLEAKSKND